MQILIVDDKPENLYMLETILKGSGYDVVTAADGVEALEKLKEDSIGIIISDILMPRMDGFQLCRTCKTDDHLKSIPFIFYTATYTDKKDEKFALSLGAEKFIIKPVEPDEFLKILEGVIEDYKKGVLIAPIMPIEEEAVYLAEYNKRLIKKLEKKMQDTERANKELRESEKSLRASEHFLSSVLESIQDGISILDTDLTIRHVNNTMIIWYLQNIPLVGKKCYECYHNRSTPCKPCPSLRCIESGKLEANIVAGIAGSPAEWIELFSYPMKDPDSGEVTGVVEFVRDITQRKLAEEALQRSERNLTISNKISQILLTVADEDMYEEVLHVILESMESKYGVFGYISENGDLVCPSMTRDIWDKCQVPDKTIIFPREKWGGIWGKALTEKKSFYSNKTFSVPEGHIPITRAIAVPIVHKGKVIGMLLVANKKTNYDEKDVSLLESLADHIAPVLDARLQRDMQDKERQKGS